VWSIVKVRKGILKGLAYAVEGLTGGNAQTEIRTEQNIKGGHLGALILACVAVIAVAYYRMTGHAGNAAATTVAMFILSFFFVAVASYIAGLVGSSNSPVSGMTICTVLITAGMLIMLGYTGAEGMLATLGVAGVVCCAAAMAGDISQDLKIGYILGATPRRQQWVEVVGTMLAALIIAPVMTLLHKAYGIGVGLKAPQAHLFKSLVGALFDPSQHMPWVLVGIGIAFGALVVIVDHFILEPRNAVFRLHIMPLAVGIYLPLSVSTPLVLGGVAAWWLQRQARKESPEAEAKVTHRGTLFASGIVAGEAIAGILIAGLIMLFARSGRSLPFAETDLTTRLGAGADILSVAAMLFVLYLMMRYAKKRA
jgi:putative OPT family oligopeptide transporter